MFLCAILCLHEVNYQYTIGLVVRKWRDAQETPYIQQKDGEQDANALGEEWWRKLRLHERV